MTPPLVDYLCKFGDTHITIASNELKQAQQVASRHPNHMTAKYLDILDAAAVEADVRKATLVISFIPSWMHMKILPICVKVGVNVTTSSYMTDAMLELNGEAKAKGLVFLNECGLDPGIDILGTMKVVHEA